MRCGFEVDSKKLEEFGVRYPMCGYRIFFKTRSRTVRKVKAK